MAVDKSKDTKILNTLHSTTESGILVHGDEVFIDSYDDNTATGKPSKGDDITTAIHKLDDSNTTLSSNFGKLLVSNDKFTKDINDAVSALSPAPVTISIVYSSYNAMLSDSNPVSTLTKIALKKGEFVIIASQDSDNNSCYRWNGSDADPKWTYINKIDARFALKENTLTYTDLGLSTGGLSTDRSVQLVDRTGKLAYPKTTLDDVKTTASDEEFNIVDAKGNVALSVSKDGVALIKLLLDNMNSNGDELNVIDALGNTLLNIGIKGLRIKQAGIDTINNVAGKSFVDLSDEKGIKAKVLSIADEEDKEVLNINKANVSFKKPVDTDTITSDGDEYNITDANGNVVMNISKDGLKLINLLAKSILSDDSEFNITDASGDSIFSVSANGVDFKLIGSNLETVIKSYAGSGSSSGGSSAYTNIINCWGDSLTMGAGTKIIGVEDNWKKALNSLLNKGYDISTLGTLLRVTYEDIVQIAAGNNYIVKNFGVGGETSVGVLARTGSLGILADRDFILKGDGTETILAKSNEITRLSNDLNGTVFGQLPITRGNDGGGTVNPVIIDGIPCTLSLGDNLTIKRNNKVSYNRTIDNSSPMYFSGIKYRNSYASIVWVGQNGGWALNNLYDPQLLILQLLRWVEIINNTNYIIVGLHTETAETRQDLETAMQKSFGRHYLNLRVLLSLQALYDFGLTPTTDADLTTVLKLNGVLSDVECMNIGQSPSSLWANAMRSGETSVDKTHMNAIGYLITGYYIAERMKELQIL